MNLKKRIQEGEGVTLDFKKTISNLEKIAKTLVAFSNNQGGTLLIGVADDGNITGVKSEDEEKYMITRAAHQFCRPAIEPVFEEIYTDHKTILVVTIPESDTKPHYALDEQKKWWVYFRVKDKSILASKIIVDVLKKQASLKGQLIIYSDHEKELLHYLADHHRITLKEYIKLHKCGYRKAQRIFVGLIVTGVLTAHLSEKEEYYTLAG